MESVSLRAYFEILPLLPCELDNNPTNPRLYFLPEKVGIRLHGAPPGADVDPFVQGDRCTWAVPGDASVGRQSDVHVYGW